jgi:hypothetical protein
MFQQHFLALSQAALHLLLLRPMWLSYLEACGKTTASIWKN